MSATEPRSRAAGPSQTPAAADGAGPVTATVPPEIAVGRDEWLFYIGDPIVFRRMFSWQPAGLWQLVGWRRLILRRIRRARDAGSRYLEFIVPDKITIHGDKLEGRFPPSHMSPGRRLGLSLPRRVRRENWIDTYSAFRAAKAEGDLYYRSDTHWRASGYMLAYRLLCEACEVEPAPHVLAASIARRSSVLDLGAKCRPPIEEILELHVFTRHARRIAQNELVTFREANPVHVVGTSFGSIIVMRNDRPEVDPRTVVVFGDSHLFHDLGAMLAESFREVHLLWASPIDWGYVERTRPAFVVHQLSERFLRRRPRDAFDIQAFAAERLKAARLTATPATQATVPWG